MNTLRLLLLTLTLPVFAQEGFTPLFNGKDLSGWDGEPGLWKVEDGVIVGTSEVGKPKTNSFLIWNGKVKDFEVRATVKVVGDNNSGVQYRSRRLPEVTPWTILGYQCDVHPTDVHTAMTYEERGRGIFGYNGVDVVLDPTGPRWQVGERPRVQADISQYNEFTVIARGNRLEHKVNGQTTSVFIDHDEKGRALEGLIAISPGVGDILAAMLRLWLKVAHQQQRRTLAALELSRRVQVRARHRDEVVKRLQIGGGQLLRPLVADVQAA